MSQHDLNIANQGFPAFRADLNDALLALGSTNSGATAPATTFANQLWYDTANNILKIRNEDNDAWISIATLDQTGDLVSAIGSTTLANLVSLAGSETLTNKTLTNPTINGFTGNTAVINIGSGQIYKTTDGKVGIGTNAPPNPLTAWAGGTLPSEVANAQFLVGNTTGFANAGIALVANASNDSTISFGSTASPTLGRIAYSNTNNAFTFSTNGANERIRINGNGIGLGATTPSSGTGITFPATQSASSDANTLDDYEEGTWTPSIGGNATYTDRYGFYTKVGNVVTVVFKIQISTLGTGGIYTINSLPFVARATAVPIGSVGYFSGITTNVYSLNCYVDPNTVNLSFVGQTSFTSSNNVPINVFQNNTLIYGTATYFV